jgi:GNAT superfamily N-acetyltransferase
MNREQAAVRRPPRGEPFDGPRACGPADLASVVDLLNHVFRGPPGNTEGPARPPALGWAYAFVYHPANLDNLRVVCHEGRVVSLVAIHPSEVRTERGTIRVGGVCGVATHPDYRRLGLSTATLEDAHAWMRAGGRHLGLLGTTIHHFYRKLGWERAGRMRTFTLDRRNITYLDASGDLEVTRSWHPHIDTLCALHNARLPAAIRTPEMMAMLLARRAPQVYVGCRGGVAVAYVALQETVVREHAGASPDVAALLHEAYEALDSAPAATSERRQRAAVELSVLTSDTRAEGDFATVLVQRGIPASLGYIGMATLLDLRGLLASLGLDALDAVETGDGHWRLHHRGRELVLSEGDLTKLFFGPERWPEFAPDLLPVDFFQWPLDRV